MKRIASLGVVVLALAFACHATFAGSVTPAPAVDDRLAVPITFHVVDTAVPRALEMLMSTAGVTFDVDPCVTGQITLDAANVPAKEVLDSIARKAGLTVTRKSSRYEIGCAGKAFAPPPVDARDVRSIANDASRRAASSGEHDSTRCRAMYREALLQCSQRTGPPVITRFDAATGHVAVGTAAIECIDNAKVALDACAETALGGRGSGRLVRINGRNLLRAYGETHDDAYAVTIVVPPGRSRKGTLWFLNGFPDGVDEKKRCRVAATIDVGGAERIYKSSLHGGIEEFSQPLALNEGSHEIEVRVEKEDSRCWFGFGAAFIEWAE